MSAPRSSGRLGSLDPARWRLIEAVLDRALELPRDQAARYLERACREDPELRSEVESLLRADAAAGGLLEEPLGAIPTALLDSHPDGGGERAAEIENRRIGAWRVLRELGHGGMGTVYLAERADGQYEQRVALKLIKRGLDTSEILARFRQERRILARLEHPGVARLVDGGVTEDGLPYFAMEYVAGETITEWCRARAVDLEGVLRLFIQVCRAVSSAHASLVVHRDLKPGNILVTERGEVKLLDFGIAKLLDPSQPGEPATIAMERRLTPHYAAPEQIRGEPATTATDVYSLGVILYELLTGARPHRGAAGAPADAQRAVLDDEPPAPSHAIRERVTQPDGAARGETSRPRAWGKWLRGDLDNIVLTAMRQEPERRYGSAEALVEDVERFLHRQPVRATRHSWTDRAGKFLRRNRIAVAAGALVFLALAGGLVGVAWQARRARDEARKAAEIRDFALGLFRASDPAEARGDTLSARVLLDRGAERAERELAGQPILQAETMALLGGVYRQLEAFDRALSMYRRAAALRERTFGAASPQVAGTLVEIGGVLTDQAELPEAERVLERALSIYRRRQARDTAYAEAIGRLGVVYQQTRRMSAAESLFRQALAIDEAALGPRHPRVAADLSNLGTLFYNSSRFDLANPYYRRALDIRRAAFGRDHPLTATALENVASTSELKLADTLHFEALAIRRRIHGPQSMYVANTLSNLGAGAMLHGSWKWAEAWTDEARRIYQARLGTDHIETARATNNLAFIYAYQWRLAESESLYRIAAAAWKNRLGPDHVNTLIAQNSLATVLRDQGELAESERLFRDVLARELRVLGPNDPTTARTYHAWALLHYRRGHLEEAESRLRRALEIRRATQAVMAMDMVVQSLNSLGGVVLDAGRLDESRRLYEEAVATGVRSLSPDNDMIAEGRMGLGRVLAAQRQFARAESLLRAAVTHRERMLPAGDPRLARAQLALGLCLARSSRQPEGESLVAASLPRVERAMGWADGLVREGRAMRGRRARPSGG